MCAQQEDGIACARFGTESMKRKLKLYVSGLLHGCIGVLLEVGAIHRVLLLLHESAEGLERVWYRCTGCSTRHQHDSQLQALRPVTFIENLNQLSRQSFVEPSEECVCDAFAAGPTRAADAMHVVLHSQRE